MPDDLLARIERFGSVRFDDYMETVLYGAGGFYAEQGRAGRRGGDFLTSPEVGPLFGTVVAAALDRCWEELGRPDPFTVVDAGAGPGTLAKAVELARPACAGALTYVLVERSASQRAIHAQRLALTAPEQAFPPEHAGVDDELGVAPVDRGRGPRFVTLAELPTIDLTGVVLANELLDNLPTRLLVRTADSWSEVRVTFDGAALAEVLVPVDEAVAEWASAAAPTAGVGARLPLQEAASRWLREVLGRLRHGRLIVIDYMGETGALAERPWDEWLRTYRAHDRGSVPLAAPGHQDLTVEVCVDQLAAVRPPDADATQADWLRSHGVEALVEEGRRVWEERAAVGDLAAVAGRSRVREAEALSDPSGLGAFRVLEWWVDRR